MASLPWRGLRFSDGWWLRENPLVSPRSQWPVPAWPSWCQFRVREASPGPGQRQAVITTITINKAHSFLAGTTLRLTWVSHWPDTIFSPRMQGLIKMTKSAHVTRSLSQVWANGPSRGRDRERSPCAAEAVTMDTRPWRLALVTTNGHSWHGHYWPIKSFLIGGKYVNTITCL